ncbi:MAG TPA: GyrI-like domain-containing protein [Terriglobales bacterium]|nr:GyrI-like domain-containing protein [Terriglobales bacterium]
MRTKHLASVIGVCFVFLSSSIAAWSGEEAPFASVKEGKPFPYCCLPHKGPLTDMGTVIGEFMQAMQGQGLFASVRGTMIGVYYNSPADAKPADLAWEVGFPVAEGAAPKLPLVVKEWKFPACAICMHKGAYEKTGETIRRLIDWAKANGYAVAGPTLERYLNNPMQVKPEELLTEIWIPVKKK